MIERRVSSVLFLALIMVLAVLGTTGAAPPAAPIAYWDPSVGGNGHFYGSIEVVDPNGEGLGWDLCRELAANTTYQRQGVTYKGHLATITSQAEQDFIVANFVSGSGLPHYWIGGYRTGTVITAGWQWVTGEAWGYTNWGGGEPNNTNWNGVEDTLHIWGHDAGSWNDQFRYSKGVTHCIIEFEPEPKAEAPAAPAIAERLLKESNVSPQYGQNGNYITEVTKKMGPGTDFMGEPKSIAGGVPNPKYEAAVKAYLISLGAALKP